MENNAEQLSLVQIQKHNKNTITLVYYPSKGETLNGSIARLSQKIEEAKQNGKYVDSVAIYIKRRKLDKPALVFATGRIKDIAYNDVTYNQMEQLLCDIQALPIITNAYKYKTVIYEDIDNLIVRYMGKIYPNNIFREEERDEIKPLLDSLEPVSNYPRIYSFVKKAMGKVQQHPDLKHVVNARIYVAKNLPGITSVSTRANDESAHSIKELRNTIIFHADLNNTTALPSDSDLMANIARVIILKALQKHNGGKKPTELEINKYLETVFNFATAYFCPACNGELQEEYIYCPHCNAKIANAHQEEAIKQSRRKFAKYYPQDNRYVK